MSFRYHEKVELYTLRTWSLIYGLLLQIKICSQLHSEQIYKGLNTQFTGITLSLTLNDSACFGAPRPLVQEWQEVAIPRSFRLPVMWHLWPVGKQVSSSVRRRLVPRSSEEADNHVVWRLLKAFLSTTKCEAEWSVSTRHAESVSLFPVSGRSLLSAAWGRRLRTFH